MVFIPCYSPVLLWKTRCVFERMHFLPPDTSCPFVKEQILTPRVDRCWRVLRAVKDSADELLRQHYTPNYLERENQLPFVVGWIFMAASGQEGVSDRRPLQQAAEALNAFLEMGTGGFLINKVLGEALGIPVDFEDE